VRMNTQEVTFPRRKAAVLFCSAHEEPSNERNPLAF